jgi:hypothetical protein
VAFRSPHCSCVPETHELLPTVYSGVRCHLVPDRASEGEETEFVWSDDCYAAFMQLKRRLVEPPILVYPDYPQRFNLYVASSRIAVGACLM